MLQYVYQTGCKRNNLLNYFGENKRNPLNECCSSCGLNQEHIINKLNKEVQPCNQEETMEKILPWQEIYKSLYNNLQD